MPTYSCSPGGMKDGTYVVTSIVIGGWSNGLSSLRDFDACFTLLDPPINRWSIVGCPCGTKAQSQDKPVRNHSACWTASYEWVWPQRTHRSERSATFLSGLLCDLWVLCGGLTTEPPDSIRHHSQNHQQVSGFEPRHELHRTPMRWRLGHGCWVGRLLARRC